MTTERQIAANRANARKSTGPKTTAGLSRSSRNAFRHGFSLAVLDEEASAKAGAIARALANGQSEQQRLAATEVAQAQLQLLQIRAVRAELMARIDPERIDQGTSNLENLKRLAALDRYEWSADTKRRRAARKLQCE
jgi:hypothetical protein